MSDHLADMLKSIQDEDAKRHERYGMQAMKKLLGGALCAYCGETLGEEGEVEQDDEGRTHHADCTEDRGKVSREDKLDPKPSCGCVGSWRDDCPDYDK